MAPISKRTCQSPLWPCTEEPGLPRGVERELVAQDSVVAAAMA